MYLAVLWIYESKHYQIYKVELNLKIPVTLLLALQINTFDTYFSATALLPQPLVNMIYSPKWEEASRGCIFKVSNFASLLLGSKPTSHSVLVQSSFPRPDNARIGGVGKSESRDFEKTREIRTRV